jgi:hypothetical protein
MQGLVVTFTLKECLGGMGGLNVIYENRRRPAPERRVSTPMQPKPSLISNLAALLKSARYLDWLDRSGGPRRTGLI